MREDVKENPDTKHPGNLRLYAKPKPTDNSRFRERKKTRSKAQETFLINFIEINFSDLKKNSFLATMHSPIQNNTVLAMYIT